MTTSGWLQLKFECHEQREEHKTTEKLEEWKSDGNVENTGLSSVNVSKTPIGKAIFSVLNLLL